MSSGIAESAPTSDLSFLLQHVDVGCRPVGVGGSSCWQCLHCRIFRRVRRLLFCSSVRSLGCSWAPRLLGSLVRSLGSWAAPLLSSVGCWAAPLLVVGDRRDLRALVDPTAAFRAPRLSDCRVDAPLLPVLLGCGAAESEGSAAAAALSALMKSGDCTSASREVASMRRRASILDGGGDHSTEVLSVLMR